MSNPTQGEQPLRLQLAGLVFVGMLAAGLRLYRLGGQGLFLDEAWSWSVTRLSPAQILSLPQVDPHPILYYLLLKAHLLVFPPTEAGLRVFSVFCSLAAVALVIGAAWRWWGGRAAFLAGWLAAFSSFDLYYAQEARMYTLLGLLWLVSIVCLAEASRGKPWILIAWAVTAVAMSWTHFYGLLIAFSQLAVLLAPLVAARLNHNSPRLSLRWAAFSAAIALAGALPILAIAWRYRAGNPGGAMVPKADALPALFSLVTVGLAPARSYFLDGAHLVGEPFAGLPGWVWTLAGLALIGGFAAWALVHTWRRQKDRRWLVIVSVASFLLPVTIFGYTFIFQKQQWAFKPFLGLAYLTYLWAGAGISRAPAPARRIVAMAVLGVSLISIAPYFSGWQKSDARQALQTTPALADNETVLFYPPYQAPLGFYYREGSTSIWGADLASPGELNLRQIAAPGILLENNRLITCEEFRALTTDTVRVYGPAERIRQEWASWPACLATKELMVFEDRQWESLNP